MCLLLSLLLKSKYKVIPSKFLLQVINNCSFINRQLSAPALV
ncbi:hypothetical protein FLA_4516 [Filimonas lacunae]|nr:hypothetical protein FLA_4516 [Filimonas lacunae]